MHVISAIELAHAFAQYRHKPTDQPTELLFLPVATVTIYVRLRHAMS